MLVKKREVATGPMKKFKNLILLQGIYIIYSSIITIGKVASNQQFMSFNFIALFGLELFIFGVYALLWQQMMKRMDLTSAYAGKGTVILWTLLWSKLFFNESISFYNIAGAIIILAGIYVVISDE